MLPIDRAAAASAIDAFLRALGYDPADPALATTRDRVTNLWADELLDGERVDLRSLLADGTPTATCHAICVLGIATHLVCPHHLTIAIGAVDVAYFPSDRVVGFGTIASLVDACAHRLTLQEDAGLRIANALADHAGARSAVVGMTMVHPCVALHGPRKREAVVRTIAFAGAAASPGEDRTVLLAEIAAVRGSPIAAKFT